MKLYAISDLHVANPSNRQALEQLQPRPLDWLILAGDIGETEDHLRFALSITNRRFAQVLWTPGNHDLWTMPTEPEDLRGEAKYQRLVQICRDHGVITPEDPYPVWRGDGPPHVVAPLFLHYDYSYRPPNVPADEAVAWAAESGAVCSDEFLLHPDPYPSHVDWCTARCALTQQRLAALPSALPIVLINHYPLREDLIHLKYFPRFSLWCGTKRTDHWHTRFPVAAAVYGHLHTRGVQRRDGVRFEEVSLGYPRDWDRSLGIEAYLRQILPAI